LKVIDRVKQAWNAFRTQETDKTDYSYGSGSYSSAPPSRTRMRFSNERSIISSIYTRISIDVSAIAVRHIKLDEFGRYSEDISSALNKALTLEANLDQGPRAFRQDIAMTLFDEGVAAIVPVDTTMNPKTSEIFDIYTLRVGKITQWYPKHVKVSVYNEDKGLREEIILEKRFVAIVENPLYAVMNEPNSTLQRLIRKLNLLDIVDEQASSGKLDLIIQLPYVIKSEARRQQAEQRRTDIEFQLKDSKYGIAYTDGTEKITQLNRSAENNLLKTIEFLTQMLYGQLGITDAVMNGTADERAMINYYNRTIEPIVDAVVEAMQRTFIGPIRSEKSERIKYYRDPFKLVPVADLAEISDKLTRNEILTANEIRGFMGIPPAKDPKADQLMNSNMPQPGGVDVSEMDKIMNEVFDGLSKDIDKIAGGGDVEPADEPTE
jgi:putative sterol carrier protein